MTTPVGSIRIDLSIDGSNLGDEITAAVQKHVKAALGDLTKMLSEVQAQMESTRRASTSVASGVEQAGKAAREATGGMSDMQQASQAAAQATKTAGDAARAAGSGMDDMGRASDKAADSTSKAGRAASQAGNEVGRFTNAAERAASVSKQLGDGMRNTASGFVRAGDAVLGAVGKFAKWTGIGAAVTGAIGGVAGSFSVLQLGMNRLTSIENARSTLQGLGHDARSVEGIMDSALTAVKGTAFGLGEAATVAASAVAAGVQPGEDLTRTLKLVGDAAAIAKTDMQSMGAIFNKVATSNKVQGEVMAQLHDRGIPILQLLSEEIGKTAEETAKMASDGKIDFETFRNAIDRGMGGAALKAGETFEGAMANMRAALGRLGAEILKGPFESAPAAIGRVTEGIDVATDAVKGMVTYLRTGEVTETFRNVFGDHNVARRVLTVLERVRTVSRQVRDGFGELQAAWRGDTGAADWARTAVDFLQDSLSRVWEIVKQLGPAVGQVAVAFGEASAAVGISTWTILLRTAEALVPILTTIADLITSHQGVVTALVAAYALLKTGFIGAAVAAKGLAVIKTVSGWMTNLIGVTTAAGTVMSTTLTTVATDADGLGSSMGGLGERTKQGMRETLRSLKALRGEIGTTMLMAGAAATATSSGIAQTIGALSSVAGGALAGSIFGPAGAAIGGAVGGGIALASYLLGENARAARAAAAAQAELAQQVQRAKEAQLASLGVQKELNAALLESAGVVDEAAVAAVARTIDNLPEMLRGRLSDDQIQGVVESIQKLGVSSESLASQLTRGGPALDATLAALRAMGGPDGERAADALLGVAARFDHARTRAESAAPALSEMAQKMGVDVLQAADDLSVALKAVPQNIPLNMDMPGAEALVGLLREAGAAVEVLGDGTVHLDVNDEKVRNAITVVDSLGWAIKQVPDTKQIEITVKTDEAALQRFISQMTTEMQKFTTLWITPQLTGEIPAGQPRPNPTTGGNALDPGFFIPGGRADGGVLPGYSPGRDNMLVPLSGGEGIIIPEAMRALGASWLYQLNSRFRPGISRRGYADGGVHRGSGALPGPVFDTRDDDEPLKLLEDIRDLLAGAGPTTAPLNVTAREVSTLADRAVGRMAGMTPGGTGPFGTPIAPRHRGYEMAAAAISALGGDPEKWLGAEPVSYWRERINESVQAVQQATSAMGPVVADMGRYVEALQEFARTGDLSAVQGVGLSATDSVITAITSARNKKTDRLSDTEIGALIEQTLGPSGYVGVLDERNASLVKSLQSFRDKVAKGSGTMTGGALVAGLPAHTGAATFSTSGLMPATAALGQAVLQMFPQIREIGGYRQDPHPDHPSGRAIDIMIPGGTTRGGRNPAGEALGDQIWNWLMSTGIVDPKGSLWKTDVGGDHFDHIHARIAEGMENAAIQAGLIPAAAGTPAASLGGLSATGGATPVFVTNWPGTGGMGMPPGLQPILDAAAQGSGEAASNVLGDVMSAVASLGQEDWAKRDASYATLNKLVRDRNPLALAAALGLDVEDFTRQGGGHGDITANDGPGYDSSGRLYSDTAALLDRTFTSLNAQLAAMRDQMVSVIEQVSHKLNDAALEPIVKAGVQSALEGLKDSVSHAIGTAMGQAAAPPIADAVRQGMASLPIATSGGDSGGNAFSGLIPGMASGGPVYGGVAGRDSVPALLMPGEHVLTTDDVARLGGQSGVYAFRAALARTGGVRGFATGGAVVNDVVGAEFFGVSQIPIIGLIVNILIRVLLSVLGVQIQARDTLLQMTDEFRQFRGDFQAFDASGRLLNDTSALVDRAQSSEEMAAQERIRILKIVIEALIRYIIEKVIVPIGKAVANAAISAGASAAGAAINTQAPGVGGIVSSLITAAGSAGVDIVAEIGTDLALAISETVIAVVAEGLQSLFPDLMTTIFGGGLLSMLLDPIGNILGNTFGGLLGGITSLLAGLFGGAATLIPGLPFDRGGIAYGTGLMPKATIAPERVLSPRQTELFERMVAALERNPRAATGSTTIVDVGGITVAGGPEAGERVRAGLMELMH